MCKSNLRDPTTLATVVIAIATVVNVGAAIYTGAKTGQYTAITQQIYKASNRPYVGIRSGQAERSDNKHLIIGFLYKNFGTVPATNLRLFTNMIIDGTTVSSGTLGDSVNHSNVFPQSEGEIHLKLNDSNRGDANRYTDIVNGKVILDIQITLRYNGISTYGNDEYEDRETWRYDSAHNSFTIVSASAK